MENTTNNVKVEVQDGKPVALEDTIDLLLGAMLNDNNPKCLEYRNTMVNTFMDIPVFKNERAILYEICKGVPDNIKLTERFISTYLKWHEAEIRDNECISLSGFASESEDGYVEFQVAVLNLYKEICRTDIPEDTFNERLELCKMIVVRDRGSEVLRKGYDIIHSGAVSDISGRFEAGVVQGFDYVQRGLKDIAKVYEKEQRLGLVKYRGGANLSRNDIEQTRQRLCGYGIKELDENTGGIHSGEFVSILAPAKGGKSRFVTQIAHSALVKDKQNVLYWPVENGVLLCESLFRARHFDYKFSKYVGGKQLSINNAEILDGNLDKDREVLEKTSWLDLQENPEYGELGIIDEDLTLETFIPTIKRYVKLMGTKVLVIDYLQLIRSSDPRKQKANIIAEAYIELLQFVKREGIACIVPAQIKQTVLKELEKTVNYAEVELRDSAGESYEVVKTPDTNFLLHSTLMESKEGVARIIPLPSRSIRPFDPVMMYTALGCCKYISQSAAV